MHLRLRFLPRRPGGDGKTAADLNELVRDFTRDRSHSCTTGCTVQEMPYDRSQYFGNNLASVYSELLNENTSALALHILSEHYRDQRHRFLMIVSALSVMYRLANNDACAVRFAVEQSLALARQAITQFGGDISVDRGISGDVSDRLKGRVRTISKHFEIDITVRRIGHLLRRSKALPDGACVGTHALHVFCNKLGFPLPEEHRLLEVVHALL